MNMEKLLILDSNSLMNRAFYALPPLTNSEGIHTNAVFGFTSMLFKIQEEIKADYVVATFDRKAPTFRHKEYKEYKAGRKSMPPELFEQFPLIKELLSLMAIDIMEIDGFEADDLIGTLAVYAESKGIEVYIVTGDRDALQLATDNVKVIITKKGITEKEIYDKDRMIEDFGVTPTEFIDVKGLMGDKSDNIPGVPGIGEKTAYKLIQTYGSVESVLQNIEEIKGKKIKENLYEYSEQALFSKKLATIKTDVPIEMDLDSIRSKEEYDILGLKKLFFKLQFKTLIDRLPKNEEDKDETPFDEYDVIEEIEGLKALKNNIKGSKENKPLYMSFDIIGQELYSNIAIESIYIDFEEKDFVIKLSNLLEKDRENTILILKEFMEDNNIKKICYDAKNAYTSFRKIGITLEGIIFDVKIANYIIDSSKGQQRLQELINEYLGREVKGEGEALKAHENRLMVELYEVLKAKIEEFNMESLLYEMELPLTKVLSHMEEEGFRINRDMLDKLGEKFKLELDKVQKEIYEFSEEEFNINSPKQLGKILFEKLDLPVIKRTKTGYSTNAEVLEALSEKHPIINKITYHRQLAKIYSTYVEGLKSVIDSDDKIHSSFNQTVTTTGRLSSTEPNLQNIPIKYEMGREIRKVFVSESEDSVILSADYSQIELRVLAHISGDENLISAFNEHSDIHTKTASEVFNTPMEEVTPLLRGRAKAVNFGIVYGISDFSLSKDLKISRKEAKQYMDAYFERYPKVKNYMEDIVVTAKKHGYVTTLLNRRRYIPEANASNMIVRASGERLAMNAPIQGTAADIIKLAMVNVQKELYKRNMKSTLILQVHDELILNVYNDELEEVKELVKKEMEEVLDLSVKLEVDINIGETWYEAK
ncbi:DNA polymerase I [Clostridium algidicarnis]|uniref:DNA polymerase I n=1 Tax=Clostridium algidicarnis TaxID=37659 RepID=UPI0016293F60|nr:DNA polymerase I [Clostridium algidicarnis]MBB6697417.1 DNA polymerase I [Clostridium algidicarnis]MBU3202684.1 DNA polymerase I [Clostridium algidicarnis]MBU3210838.1 DNA polymerase I [Clostridium algidicarnis]MBU3222654.1 DNA polymerase I [Clostridium algidicarnis]